MPVWHIGLTLEQSNQIERVQKNSLAAIMGSEYTRYSEVLQKTGLQSLAERQVKICSNFITKNMKSERPLLSRVKKLYNTRSVESMVNEYQCRTQAFFDSGLPFLARIFNHGLM